MPSLREYSDPLRADARAGRAGCATHALVMHPGPMNRGVEIARRSGRAARRGDHPAGRQRRRRADGGAVRPARLGRRPADLEERRVTAVADHGAARVVDQTASARADVRDRRTAAIVAVGDGARRSAATTTCSTPTGCVVAPGLRRPPRPPARAGPGGGRDDRDRQPGRRARRLHRGRGDAQHRPGAGLARRRRVRARARARAAGLCEVLPGRVHHVGRARRAAGAVRRAGRRRRAALHRRRQRRAGPAADAPGAWSTRSASTSCSPSTARSRALTEGRCMHEGQCCSGSACPAGRPMAEELMVAPRHRAGPAHRRPDPPPAPVDGRQRRAGARPPRPTGCRSPPRPRPHHFTPHRRAAAPATTRCSRSTRRCAPTADVAAVQRRAGRRHDRRHRHRPRAAHPGDQGAAARPGAARDARPRDRARRWRSPSSTCRSPTCVAALSWKPAAIAGVADRHGRPIAAGRARPTSCVFDPDADVGGRARRALASRSRNTPYVGAHAARPGPPHALRRRAGRHRRRGANDDQHSIAMNMQ